MSAKIVYDIRGGSGSKSNAGAEGLLFSGFKFFFSHSTPSKSHFVELVQSNGGEVTNLEANANIWITDHLKKTSNPDMVSYKFVEASVSGGALENIDDFKVARMQTRTVKKSAGARRTTSAPTHIHSNIPNGVKKVGRTAFTQEDDYIILKYLEDHATPYGTKNAPKGMAIYKEIEALYPHHTHQSWQDRWRKTLAPQYNDIPKAPAGFDLPPPKGGDMQNLPRSPRRTPRKPPATQEAPNSAAKAQRPKFTKEEKTAMYDKRFELLDPAKVKQTALGLYNLFGTHTPGTWIAEFKAKIAPKMSIDDKYASFTDDDRDLLISLEEQLTFAEDTMSLCHGIASRNPQHTATEWHDYFMEIVLPKVQHDKVKTKDDGTVNTRVVNGKRKTPPSPIDNHVNMPTATKESTNPPMDTDDETTEDEAEEAPVVPVAPVSVGERVAHEILKSADAFVKALSRRASPQVHVKLEDAVDDRDTAQLIEDVPQFEQAVVTHDPVHVASNGPELANHEQLTRPDSPERQSNQTQTQTSQRKEAAVSPSATQLRRDLHATEAELLEAKRTLEALDEEAEEEEVAEEEEEEGEEEQEQQNVNEVFNNFQSLEVVTEAAKEEEQLRIEAEDKAEELRLALLREEEELAQLELDLSALDTQVKEEPNDEYTQPFDENTRTSKDILHSEDTENNASIVHVKSEPPENFLVPPSSPPRALLPHDTTITTTTLDLPDPSITPLIPESPFEPPSSIRKRMIEDESEDIPYAIPTAVAGIRSTPAAKGDTKRRRGGKNGRLYVASTPDPELDSHANRTDDLVPADSGLDSDRIDIQSPLQQKSRRTVRPTMSGSPTPRRQLATLEVIANNNDEDEGDADTIMFNASTPIRNSNLLTRIPSPELGTDESERDNTPRAFTQIPQTPPNLLQDEALASQETQDDAETTDEEDSPWSSLQEFQQAMVEKYAVQTFHVGYALQRTCKDYELAEQVLKVMVQYCPGGGIDNDFPLPNTPGVWTESDDDQLRNRGNQGLNRMQRKHGTDNVEMRLEYLDAWEKLERVMVVRARGGVV